MTVTELIECLQKLIAQRPDVAGMYVMLDDDPPSVSAMRVW
jgi:hypothetical protein